MENRRAKIDKLAKDYFEFMAAAYPVMCLSDEFYYLPRAEGAIRYLNHLDSLSPDKIKQDIRYAKRLRQNLEKLSPAGNKIPNGKNAEDMTLDDEIDRELLIASINGFIEKFDKLEVWRTDPSLYLKIVIFGIEQIINKLWDIRATAPEALILRIKQIPRILKEAETNLKAPISGSQQVAAQMCAALINYLAKGLSLSLMKKGIKLKGLNSLNRKATQSLENFQKFLKKQPACEIFSTEYTKEQGSNDSPLRRSMEEIFAIASDELNKTKRCLKQAARQLNPCLCWQEILGNYKIKAANKKELLSLYFGIIASLKEFLVKGGVLSFPRLQDIKVAQTPAYLEPIRASASYSCPITNSIKENAFFYVSIAKIPENIHQEHLYVSAHEAYPGHHLLDSIRKRIKNPIRRQIELPLFYEGWASYAETLVDEFAASCDPRQKLIGLRRQAWRAIRAKLDAGIRINKMNPQDAEKELLGLGYSVSRVKLMLKNYLLTPGYQLCYTIGKFEIEKLKKRFVVKMGLKNFHDSLLSGGQLPFDLVEKKMDAICAKNF